MYSQWWFWATVGYFAVGLSLAVLFSRQVHRCIQRAPVSSEFMRLAWATVASMVVLWPGLALVPTALEHPRGRRLLSWVAGIPESELPTNQDS